MIGLKEIVAAAKFGKLLPIGNNLPIKDIGQAFKITKEICLVENKSNDMDQYIGIKKTFNL